MKNLLFVLVLFSATVPPLAGQGGYSYVGANAYVGRKDWSGLMAYCTAWTRADPNDPMAWYYLGQTYGVGLNQPAQAANAFRRAVALKPQWPEAWHALAVTCNQTGQYQEEANAARHAIAQMPDRPNYWNDLAVAYSQMGDWKDMVRTLEQEQQHMTRATSYDWYNLGNAYHSVVHAKEAETCLLQSVKMNPQMGMAWNNLGVVEQGLGNYQAALADYRRAASLGDGFASGNYARLNRALTPPSARRGNGPTPAQVITAVREGQYHNWLANNPGGSRAQDDNSHY
jgi:tetratricopeptide (TPR) repeat protein